MRIPCLLVAFLSLELAASSQVRDVKGWSKATWGMDRAAVKAAFPSAIQLSKDRRITPPGVNCELRVENYEILDTTRASSSFQFEVNFCFAPNGGLDQIALILRYQGEEARIWKAEGDFNAVETMMVERFAPLSILECKSAAVSRVRGYTAVT